ncbi:hypothetical protein IGI04_030609 [Brassica rapa subsp. trilocularis]|uniref:Uncharacterized protein n=1 Tax=Brassica rapa subsp. trilocularis TaxID=1813537 RepID=A0ABQ7LTW8_BRACM|nr:hypothetical protein IGI04_030609 [Brassica rapa subsp. trilocularis]
MYRLPTMYIATQTRSRGQLVGIDMSQLMRGETELYEYRILEYNHGRRSLKLLFRWSISNMDFGGRRANKKRGRVDDLLMANKRRGQFS